MLIPIYATVLVALFFYLLLPGLAALRNASSWRAFRRRLASLSGAPLLDYAAAAAARLAWAARGSTDADTGGGQSYRLFGVVEAMEGKDRLWVRSPSLSAVVDFSRSPLYVLGPRGADTAFDSTERAGSIERLNWRTVRSLSEGTRILVEGRVSYEGCHPLFREAVGEPLVVVAHDEAESRLEACLIAGGRSRNELWSRSTFVFWALGLGVSSVLYLYLSQVDTLSSIRYLSYLLALSPLLPFVPPGALFFLLANRAWHRCLKRRMERELASLSHPPSGIKPSSTGERRKLWRLSMYHAAETVAFAALAYLVNFALALVVWRAFFQVR